MANFQYLGADDDAEGSMEAGVDLTIGEEAKVLGALKGIWRKREICMRSQKWKCLSELFCMVVKNGL